METTYRVTVKRLRDGKWRSSIEQLPGEGDQGVSLEAVQLATRWSITIAVGLPKEQAAELLIQWTLVTGNQQLDDTAAKLRELKDGERRLRARIQADTARMTSVAGGVGLTVRDTAVLLGCSPRRVQQLRDSKGKLVASPAENN